MGNKRQYIFPAGCSVFFVIFFSTSALQALDITPFHTRNQSPLVQIYGLPAPGNAFLLPPGGKEVHAVLDRSSNFVDDTAAGEQILLDGETTRMAISGRYGLGENVELGFELPYVDHSGGFLDGFIIDFHDFFGLPQGGRDQAPRNRLLYRYTRNGVEKLRLDQSGGGLGDVSLAAGYKLYHDGKEFPTAVAIRASLKLPTGDSDALRGSGSTDFSGWLTASRAYKLPLGHGATYAAAGLLAMTNGDILPDQQRRQVGFGSLGTGWSPLSWLALKLQFDAHTAFYNDSGLRALSENAVQVQIGGTLRLSERMTLDIAVSEDIVTQTSPDVVFHFDLGMRF